MDFFHIIEQRHSVRCYLDKPIDSEKVQKICEAANKAPSAGNKQAYEIYLIRQHTQRTALAQACFDQEFIGQAPLLLVFCAHPALSEVRYGQRGRDLYSIQDATIACTFAMLAAASMELSTVWVGAFNENAVSEVIGLPSGLRPVAILPVGYAGESPRIRGRRELTDLVHEL